MKVYTDTTSLPVFRNAVVTIGTFDGVHRGHRQIIDQLKEEATKINGESVIITFHPHPRKVVGEPTRSLYLLNTPEEKKRLLEKAGIDNLVIVPFTEAFANQSAAAYVEDFLLKNFHPHTLIIGYDHRFGKGRTGNFQLLEKYAQEKGFHLIEIPQHLLNESAISSTRIRESLLQGKIKEANALLGYTYFFEGTVVEGNRLGRTIGFPTANLRVDQEEKLVPANGVYAVQVELPLKAGETTPRLKKGMMNIGVRPTVDGTHRVIEVNIFDFNDTIYGQTVRILVHAHLRPEQKFESIDLLKEQLAKDREQAMNSNTD